MLTVLLRSVFVLCFGATVASAQWAPLLEDNTAVLDVPGEVNPDPIWWPDSYSVGNRCYCKTTFDHDIGKLWIDTPLGSRNLFDVCALLGPGPGSEGRPLYNDIQCGNGPSNGFGDETNCPGRVEYGKEGCGHIGPKFNFDTGGGEGQPTPLPPPVAAPVSAPVVAPVSAPVAAPVPSPVSNGCGDVNNIPWHPHAHENAMGGMLGNGDLIVASGNWWSLQQQTTAVYAFNTATATPWAESWRELASIPLSPGLTKAATAISGNKMYLCGGVIGFSTTNRCLLYDGSSNAWEELPSLPEPRAGGALLYSGERIALIFSGGDEGQKDTWVLYLEDPSKTWYRKSDFPSDSGSAMLGATATTSDGSVQHFALRDGTLYEWDLWGEFWAWRSSASFGSASNMMSSNCGIISVAGSDVWFFRNNGWSKVGVLPRSLATPICGVRGGFLYCTGGTVKDNSFSIRWSIEG